MSRGEEPDRELPRAELLVHRAVEGSASPDEWDELEGLALDAPELFERIARALQVRALVAASIGPDLARADAVALPAARRRPRALWRGRLRESAGWAAALVLAAAWVAERRPAAPLGSPPPSAPALSAVEPSAADLLERYRRAAAAEGRALGELPRVLLHSRPAPEGGGLELVYVRRLVEREVVADLYRLAPDEVGLPTAVKVDASTLVAGGRL